MIKKFLCAVLVILSLMALCVCAATSTKDFNIDDIKFESTLSDGKMSITASTKILRAKYEEGSKNVRMFLATYKDSTLTNIKSEVYTVEGMAWSKPISVSGEVQPGEICKAFVVAESFTPVAKVMQRNFSKEITVKASDVYDSKLDIAVLQKYALNLTGDTKIFSYWEKGRGNDIQISTQQIANDATVVWNNSSPYLLTSTNMDRDSVAGKRGTVTIKDEDGDFLYEKIEVTSYDTAIVYEIDVDQKRIFFASERTAPKGSVILDEIENVSITLNNNPATISELRKNDVLHIAIDDWYEPTYCKIVATRNFVEGMVTSRSEYEKWVKIGENIYAVDTDVISMPQLEDYGKFYLDSEGKIAFYVKTSPLEIYGNYGYIADVVADGFGAVRLSMITTDNKLKTFTLGDAVNIGSGNTSTSVAPADTLTDSNLYSVFGHKPTSSSPYVLSDIFDTESTEPLTLGNMLVAMANNVELKTNFTLSGAAVHDRLIRYYETDGVINRIAFAKSTASADVFGMYLRGWDKAWVKNTQKLAGYKLSDTVHVFVIDPDGDIENSGCGGIELLVDGQLYDCCLYGYMNTGMKIAVVNGSYPCEVPEVTYTTSRGYLYDAIDNGIANASVRFFDEKDISVSGIMHSRISINGVRKSYAYEGYTIGDINTIFGSSLANASDIAYMSDVFEGGSTAEMVTSASLIANLANGTPLVSTVSPTGSAFADRMAEYTISSEYKITEIALPKKNALSADFRYVESVNEAVYSASERKFAGSTVMLNENSIVFRVDPDVTEDCVADDVYSFVDNAKYIAHMYRDSAGKMYAVIESEDVSEVLANSKLYAYNYYMRNMINWVEYYDVECYGLGETSSTILRFSAEEENVTTMWPGDVFICVTNGKNVVVKSEVIFSPGDSAIPFGTDFDNYINLSGVEDYYKIAGTGGNRKNEVCFGYICGIMVENDGIQIKIADESGSINSFKTFVLPKRSGATSYCASDIRMPLEYKAWGDVYCSAFSKTDDGSMDFTTSELDYMKYGLIKLTDGVATDFMYIKYSRYY